MKKIKVAAVSLLVVSSIHADLISQLTGLAGDIISQISSLLSGTATAQLQCTLNPPDLPGGLPNASSLCSLVSLPNLQIPYCSSPFLDSAYDSLSSIVKNVCNAMTGVVDTNIEKIYGEKDAILKLANIDYSASLSYQCGTEEPLGSDTEENLTFTSMKQIIGYDAAVIRDYNIVRYGSYKAKDFNETQEEIYKIDPSETEADVIEKMSKNVKDLTGEVSYVNVKNADTTDRKIKNETADCYEKETKSEIDNCLKSYFSQEDSKIKAAKEEIGTKESLKRVMIDRATLKENNVIYPLESVFFKTPASLVGSYKFASYKMFRLNIFIEVLRDRLRKLEEKLLEIEKQRKIACTVSFGFEKNMKQVEELLKSVGVEQ